MPKLIKNAKITILQKAKSILLEQGLSSLNMRGLAAEAGVAAGTLYNYFSSKEELVRAVLAEDWSKMLLKMEIAVSVAATAMEGLEAIYDAIRAFAAPYDAIFHSLRTTEIFLDVRTHYRTGIIQNLTEKIRPLGERFGFLFDETVAPFLAEALMSSAVHPGTDFESLKACLQKIVS